MQSKIETIPTFTMEYDGFTLNTSIGSWSVRLSNVLKNVEFATQLCTPLFFNALSYGAQAYYTAIYNFNSEGNSHYRILLKEPSRQVLHIWTKLKDENPCGFTNLSIAYESTAFYSRENVLSENGYTYNNIINWQNGAKLYLRWLEPSNQTLETCINTMMEPSQVIIPWKALATFGLFAGGCIWAYKKLPSSDQTKYDPLDILGKSQATKPSFSERMEAFNEIEVPSKFVCPISKQIMNDPILIGDGNFYDRESIKIFLKTMKLKADCPLNPNIKINIQFYPTAILMKNEISEFVTNLESTRIVNKI